jgi:hypothetical protein
MQLSMPDGLGLRKLPPCFNRFANHGREQSAAREYATDRRTRSPQAADDRPDDCDDGADDCNGRPDGCNGEPDK